MAGEGWAWGVQPRQRQGYPGYPSIHCSAPGDDISQQLQLQEPVAMTGHAESGGGMSSGYRATVQLLYLLVAAGSTRSTAAGYCVSVMLYP